MYLVLSFLLHLLREKAGFRYRPEGGPFLMVRRTDRKECLGSLCLPPDKP